MKLVQSEQSVASAKPVISRQWRQFGIRSLLVLLLLSGIVVNFANRGYRQDAIVATIRGMGGQVWYESQIDDNGKAISAKNSTFKIDTTHVENDFFERVVRVDLPRPNYLFQRNIKPRLSREQLKPEIWKSIAEFRDLKFLAAPASQIEDLGPISDLRRLEKLDLSGTQVSDISPLENMKNLQELNLGGTSVSDLTPLGKLHQLSQLTLEDTRVADIQPLAGHSKLVLLNLEGTGVSDIGPLQQLLQLRRLFLSQTKVDDLSALEGHDKLEFLDISKTGVKKLDPINGLSRLTWLCIERGKIDLQSLKSFSEATPECYVTN